MLDNPEHDDDVTLFEDAEPETVFDPNPWGARQRVKPSPRFVASPPPATTRWPTIPTLADRFVQAVTATAPVPLPTIAWPTPIPPTMPAPAAAPAITWPAPAPLPRAWQPASPRRGRMLASKFAVPLGLAGIVCALAIVYVAKPTARTRAPMHVPAASLTAIARSSAPIVEPIVEPKVAVAVAPIVGAVAVPASPRIARAIAPARAQPAQLTTRPSRTPARPSAAPRAKKRPRLTIDTTDTASPLGRMRPGRS